MINEQEYNDFIWIHENLDQFRNDNNFSNIGAIDPFKASPFSAVTGLYIVSSSMHPLYGYNLKEEMKSFLENHCQDTNFIIENKISIIYTTNCNNENLTMIHPNTYIYN